MTRKDAVLRKQDEVYCSRGRLLTNMKRTDMENLSMTGHSIQVERESNRHVMKKDFGTWNTGERGIRIHATEEEDYLEYN